MLRGKTFPGFQWADPFAGDKELRVELVGRELHVTGLVPFYLNENLLPTDLIREYGFAAKFGSPERQRRAGKSPDVLFANADTDEKLVAFVRRFGPIVAKEAYTDFERLEKGLSEPRLPARLFAVQDMQELRDEQVIFRSALELIVKLKKPHFNFSLAQGLIGEIAARVVSWPGQREREGRLQKIDPFWNLSSGAIARIRGLASGPLGFPPIPEVGSRIVLCELVNTFRPMVFPNPLEMHASIKFGIRPLLYAILLREFVYPRDVAACANTQCRSFFRLERRGQVFCGPECSIHQRQRSYWAVRGKKLRRKRVAARRKGRNKK